MLDNSVPTVMGAWKIKRLHIVDIRKYVQVRLGKSWHTGMDEKDPQGNFSFHMASITSNTIFARRSHEFSRATISRR